MLSGARTARFNANLVQRGLAYTANSVTSYPGDKHACVMLLYALPAKGVGLLGIERALADQLSALAASGPTDRELQRIKKARQGSRTPSCCLPVCISLELARGTLGTQSACQHPAPDLLQAS